MYAFNICFAWMTLQYEHNCGMSSPPNSIVKITIVSLYFLFVSNARTIILYSSRWCTYIVSFSIQSCRSCYATLRLCQRPFYKIFVKFRNSKKNVLKIVLIIVNINKDENKSLISNKFSLENDLWSFLTF